MDCPETAVLRQSIKDEIRKKKIDCLEVSSSVVKSINLRSRRVIMFALTSWQFKSSWVRDPIRLGRSSRDQFQEKAYREKCFFCLCFPSFLVLLTATFYFWLLLFISREWLNRPTLDNLGQSSAFIKHRSLDYWTFGGSVLRCAFILVVDRRVYEHITQC